MVTKQQIVGGELVKDLRSGMTVAQLMAKYGVSAEELRSILKQLENAGTSISALYGRSSDDTTTKEGKRIRLLPRHKVAVPVPIHDAEDLRIRGVLFDINEKGFGVEGINARQDEIRRFIILADQFFPIAPFKVEASCRWTRATGDERRFMAGFRITTMSEKAFQELRSLVTAVARAEEASKPVGESGIFALRSTYGEQVSTIWTCPFCKMPQPREYDECPQCGIIASKYQRQKPRTNAEVAKLIEADKPAPSPDASVVGKMEMVAKTVSVPLRVWQQLEVLGGNVDEHVTKALAAYLLRLGSGWTRK